LKNPFVIAIVLLLFYSTGVNSQNISKYLNDGTHSTSKNIIFIGYDAFNGELPIIFEHSVISKFSFQAGGGPLWLAKQSFMHPDEPLPLKQTVMGWNAFIKAKIYLGTFPERFYVTIYPEINLMDKKIFYDISIFNVGYQRVILKKLVVGAEVGATFRLYKDPIVAGSVELKNTSVVFQIPATLQMGYLF